MSTQKKSKTTALLIAVAVLSFVAGIIMSSNKTGDSVSEISQKGKETDVFVGLTNTVNPRIEKKAKSLNFTFDGGYSIKVQ